ncbi:MAG: MFS transporter [Burkholderiales bacterium]|nr:MFS transporter [Burkholderiales bacterium]
MKHALRALRSRNFRVFYAGIAVSVFGTWMQTVAASWLVYRLTGSAFLLGLVAAVQQLPMLVLGPLAGVWGDRADRRRLLIATQLLALLQAAALAGLTFAGIVTPTHVVLASLALGVINAVETPTRQAFLLEMVESKEDLPNAIALQSTMFNSARLVGPTLAGFIVAGFGEAWCFTLNAASYFGIVAAYLAVQVKARAARRPPAHLLTELAAGFRWVFGLMPARRLIYLIAGVSFFSAPWQPLMPIVAAERFGGGSGTFGLLIGAVGGGALCGTLFLALRSSILGLGRVIAGASLAAGIGLTVFAAAPWLPLAAAGLPVLGFGVIVAGASTNTILQTIAAEDLRARVISIYVTVFLGMGPIANFIAGAVAEWLGARWTLFIYGLALTACAALFVRSYASWRDGIRQVYRELGMLSEAPG